MSERTETGQVEPNEQDAAADETQDAAASGAAEAAGESARMAPEDATEAAAEDASKAAADEAAALVASEVGETEPGEEPDEVDDTPIAPVLEAILFAAAEPVPLQRLSRLFQGRGRGAVKQALGELRETLEQSTRGVRLVEVSSGFQLRSAPAHAPWLQRFFAEKPPRLSRALLETVAIVAYRQPVTRGEIEAIRGVNCDAILTALVNRDLILATGRRDTPGRPVEYGTTSDFLELFTMKDLGELPPLPDAESLADLLKSTDDPEDAAEGEQAAADAEGAAMPATGEAPASDDASADGDGDEASASSEDAPAAHDASADEVSAPVEETDEDPGDSPQPGGGRVLDPAAEVAAGSAEDAAGDGDAAREAAEEEETPRAAAMAAAAGAAMPGATVTVDTAADGLGDATERTDPEDSESRGDRVEAGRGGLDP